MHGVRLGWQDLPQQLRAWVGEALGSPVVQAVSQPAGFSPGSADRIRTAAGSRAFVKAVSVAQNPDTPALHRREAGILRTLAHVEAVPSLIDAYDDGDWVALVIEDVEGAHPLPWTHELLSATLDALGELSAVAAPQGWPALEEELTAEMDRWALVRAERPEDLDPWLAEHLDELHALARQTLPRLAGEHVAHTDVRADNLLVDDRGRILLVDWPWASRGAAWADAAMLLLNVRWAGDLDVRPHLPRLHALGATDEDVLGLLSGLTGFCTDACRRPPAPGLPTLRRFQQEQAVAGTRLLQELWPGPTG